MRNNRAFTLIEVMVVLSILALIAILAYNFFGNTMKEATIKQAATQYNRAFSTISTALEVYTLDNGGTFPTSKASGSALAGVLVTGGYIKAMPVVDYDDLEWYCTGMEDMGGPTTTEECQIYANTLNKDICEQLNESWGLPKAVYDYTAKGDSLAAAGSIGVCTDWGSGVNGNDYYIFYTVDPR